MALVSYGSEPPKPRQVSNGWAIPLGGTSETDDDGLATYSAYEVIAATLFQHDIEAAIAEADDLPEGDYSADVLEAIKHGIRLQRAAEYPPASEYLDGIAKGDEAQVEAYKAACRLVKASHPMPIIYNGKIGLPSDFDLSNEQLAGLSDSGDSDLLPKPDYLTFWDALLISGVYQAIRAQALNKPAVLVACTEFIAAIGDAKMGRANTSAIQSCIDNLLDAGTFSEDDLAELHDLLAAGNLEGIYTLNI